jgi:hypothetical protein
MGTWAVEGGEWQRLPEPDQDELQDSLRASGWEVEDVDGGQAYVVPGGCSYADGGQFGVDFYWEVDEALQVAEEMGR